MSAEPKDDVGATAAGTDLAEPIRDAIDLGLQSMDSVAALTRHHVQTMLAAAQVAAHGFGGIWGNLADFSRESFERTVTAARTMGAATSLKHLLQLQAEYSRQQLEAALNEMATLSKAMTKGVRAPPADGRPLSPAPRQETYT